MSKGDESNIKLKEDMFLHTIFISIFGSDRDLSYREKKAKLNFVSLGNEWAMHCIVYRIGRFQASIVILIPKSIFFLINIVKRHFDMKFSPSTKKLSKRALALLKLISRLRISEHFL